MSNKNSIKVKIVFYGDGSVVKSLYNSLHPDNIVVPKYMAIEEDLEDNMYSIIFSGELRSRVIDAIKQSVDEILALTSMINRSLSKIGRQ